MPADHRDNTPEFDLSVRQTINTNRRALADMINPVDQIVCIVHQ